MDAVGMYVIIAIGIIAVSVISGAQAGHAKEKARKEFEEYYKKLNNK